MLLQLLLGAEMKEDEWNEMMRMWVGWVVGLVVRCGDRWVGCSRKPTTQGGEWATCSEWGRLNEAPNKKLSRFWMDSQVPWQAAPGLGKRAAVHFMRYKGVPIYLRVSWNSGTRLYRPGAEPAYLRLNYLWNRLCRHWEFYHCIHDFKKLEFP